MELASYIQLYAGRVAGRVLDAGRQAGCWSARRRQAGKQGTRGSKHQKPLVVCE